MTTESSKSVTNNSIVSRMNFSGNVGHVTILVECLLLHAV